MSLITITKDNFEQEVLHSDQPVLIDFWAPWCGPCRMLSPVLDQLAGELTGKVKLGKVNVDEEPELASEFRVMSIPMVAVIKNGTLTASAVGLRPKEAIVSMLEE